MAQLNDNQADKMKGKAVLYKGSLFSVDELVYSGNLSDDPTVDNNDGESDFEDDASDNELDDPSERNSSDAVGSGSIAQQVVGGSVGGSAALGTTSATTSTTGAQTNGVKKTNKTPPQSKTKGKGRKPAIPKTIDRPMKYTKRPRPKNNIYKASPELQWLKTRGVAAAMKKYHLTIHKDCRETPILDTTPKNPQGLKQYRSIACGLEFFFAMIGDFESCLIMQPKQFDQVVPAMNPESIQLFLKWKSGVAGEPLTRSNGDPVFDVFGEALIRTGAWKDANSGQQVYATVAAIHKNRGHPRNMPYVEQCLPCFNLMDSRGSSGCQDHRANPRPKRTGNARFSTVAMDGLKNLKAELSAHAPNGDSPLLPHELLKWRKYLMDKGSFWSSQQWVMSLLASKLGLRMDELCKIQMKHIHLAVSPVVQAPNGKVVVHGLCFEIQGKTDTHPVYLIAWADFENPELDPVRHVLAHIHQLDCKGGFLFPSKLEWERFKATQPADGIIRDRISDNDFMEEIREGLHHVFGAAEFQDPSEFQAVANDELPQPYMPQMVDRPRIFGTHTFRKTYFLLAAFSQASDIDMALGARHKTMNTSMRYKEDNATLLEIWRQCGQDTGLKMVWKSIYLGQTTTARAIIDNPFKHPLDLAKAFCVRNCGIRLDTVN
ncbi:hypothetical protein BDR26DRAFT_942334 [Obelidium mucronatum]|nr:hypothetical protein BDR26DRAFT_942334 [Obelidium mucronatum]